MGVAGIGKSRLAWELDKHIDGIAEDVYWHHGRSPAYGEGVAFWALGEMVRQRAGIAETDSPDVARQRLSTSLDDFVPDPTERAWIGPRLAGLLGLDNAPTTERSDLFAAWRTFFERVAEHGTTVMVFEDIQWADQGLLDFIGSLVEWSRAHPILIVTLARPELLERRPDWGRGARSFTSLHLEPLEEGAMRELLAGLARELPAALADRIVAALRGHPALCRRDRAHADRRWAAGPRRRRRPAYRSAIRARSASPTRCAGSSPPDSTRSSRRIVRWSRMPPSSDSRSPARAWRAISGLDRDVVEVAPGRPRPARGRRL